jgi:hypothetical protein
MLTAHSFSYGLNDNNEIYDRAAAHGRFDLRPLKNWPHEQCTAGANLTSPESVFSHYFE